MQTTIRSSSLTVKNASGSYENKKSASKKNVN